MLNDSDGGASIAYAGPSGRYRSTFNVAHGYAEIGVSARPVEPAQTRAAALLGAVQQAGHWPGRISLVKPDRYERTHRHFAAFARAKGWPEAYNGEQMRVMRAFHLGE